MWRGTGRGKTKRDRAERSLTPTPPRPIKADVEEFILGEPLGPARHRPSESMGKERELRLAKETRVQTTKSPPAQHNPISRLVSRGAMGRWVPRLLAAGGLHGAAKRGFTDFRVSRRAISAPTLPDSLYGLRILHISDLHLDLCPAFPQKLGEFLLREHAAIQTADIAVITGDFQEHYLNPPGDSIGILRELLPLIPCPIFCILGNHDRLAIADEIAGIQTPGGLRVLLNQTARLETKSGKAIEIQGVDDPHYYQSHKIQKLDCPHFKILLAHSPEIYREAETKGFDLCLSGHTHGGQFRLPLLGPVLRGGKIPQPMIRGVWRHKRMAGHTSPGVGASTLPLRLCCPPEIALLSLL